MIGVAGPARRRVLLLAAVLLVAVALVVHVAARARGAAGDRCEQFHAASQARAAVVTGSGVDVLVIGDSFAAGLGLGDVARSWPSRLAGRVHVAGFSGSGFSRDASACGDVSFASRAPAALGRVHPELVVVEGGLNDVDQPAVAVRTGFERLMRSLDGRRVVVVGPPAAPARAAGVPAVDALLARLAERHGAAYVPTTDLDLPYLDDRLHLTPAGHRAFGDAVAERIAALG